MVLGRSMDRDVASMLSYFMGILSLPAPAPRSATQPDGGRACETQQPNHGNVHRFWYGWKM
jgi:hypothetical protein